MQWLRDKIKFIKKASDTEKIIKSLKSNNGIYLVPALQDLVLLIGQLMQEECCQV